MRIGHQQGHASADADRQRVATGSERLAGYLLAHGFRQNRRLAQPHAGAHHQKFLAAYQAKYKDYPRLGSVVGYSMIKSAAAGIAKAKSTETEKLVTAFSGLNFTTPFGKTTFRKQDNQSTMGAFLGRTKNDGGKGVLVDYRYIDGASVQPSDDVVKKLRPSN